MAVPQIRLQTRKRCLRVGSSVFACRSEAPFRFLARLWWQQIMHPAQPWVTVEELSLCLGTATHPRQMLRTVNWLEGTALGLVHFETRTRGRYRLACASEQLQPDLACAALGRWLGLDGAGEEKEEGAALVGDALDHTVQTLLCADSDYNDGRLKDGGEPAQLPVPMHPADPLWQALFALRQAQVALRLGEYARMEELLALVGRAVRNGDIRQSHMAARADLLAARAQYDRGRLLEAERLWRRAGESIGGDVWTEGRYHDLAALLAYARWRPTLSGGARLDERSVEALSRLQMRFSTAIGCQMQVMDYQGLQATACNLARTLLTPAICCSEHALVANWAEKGLRWLAQSSYISHHFFVGMDSVAPQVLALEAVASGCVEFLRLNEVTQRIFGNLPDLEAAWQHTYRLARQIGNPVELEALHALRRRLPVRSVL